MRRFKASRCICTCHIGTTIPQETFSAPIPSYKLPAETYHRQGSRLCVRKHLTLYTEGMLSRPERLQFLYLESSASACTAVPYLPLSSARVGLSIPILISDHSIQWTQMPLWLINEHGRNRRPPMLNVLWILRHEKTISFCRDICRLGINQDNTDSYNYKSVTIRMIFC